MSKSKTPYRDKNISERLQSNQETIKKHEGIGTCKPPSLHMKTIVRSLLSI